MTNANIIIKDGKNRIYCKNVISIQHEDKFDNIVLNVETLENNVIKIIDNSKYVDETISAIDRATLQEKKIVMSIGWSKGFRLLNDIEVI